jgi:outer membrane protein OmpA-like peptidoglycan-associated protein
MKVKNLAISMFIATMGTAMVGCGHYSHPASKHQPEVSSYKAEMPEAKMVASTYHFKFDDATLTSENKTELHKVVRLAQQHPDQNIRVEGYTDTRGRSGYNLALGLRRAQAVAHFLESQGVAHDQIEVYSYGAENLIDTSDNDQAHARNRRVEVYFESTNM